MKRFLKTAALTLASVIMLSACGGGSADQLAKVNGQVITKDDFKRTLSLYSPSYELQFGPTVWEMEIEPGVTFAQKFQEEIYEKMITDKVLEEAATEEGITVTDEEVEKDFEELSATLKQQEAFKKMMDENKIDDEYLKGQIKKDKTIQKFFDKKMEESKVSDEEAKKYYDEHIEDFTKSEVKASHILISTRDEATQAPLSDAEKAKKKEEAEAILKQAKSGKNFAELAQQHSQDPGSAKLGGDLGYFDKKRMVPEFSEVAFALKVGEISDLVETEYGYHIIKLIDKKEAEVESFESVKQGIKDNLEYDKYNALVEELKGKAKIERSEENLKKVEEEIAKEREQKAKADQEASAPAEGEQNAENTEGTENTEATDSTK
ncbi:peptidylprolyl isomerase [Filifactor villosus]|uniref:Peptidylprolyl isomerase n=1 Tax=Filifactor villosus TaxID=29374 RepID=A0ABV9QI58_9FIRM